MAKRKPKNREQQVVAEESVSAQERRTLRQQISTLKRLPSDFRDIVAGTSDWEAFASITERRKEMEAWDNGPVLFLAPLNKHEIMILGSQNELMGIKTVVTTSNSTNTVKAMFSTAATACASFNKATWHIILSWAEKNKVSWIYLPDEETKFITAFNKVLSRFDYNVRIKGRLMSEMSGKPLGVVR